MRILFFARLYYPHIGGVEKHVFEISKRLAAQGHEITIVTEELPHINVPAKSLDRETVVKVIRIPVGSNNWFKKFRIWKWFFENQDILKNADIIHCHDVFFWYLPFRFLYPFKKVYTTFHGYETFPPKKRAIYLRRISNLLSAGSINVGHFIEKWYGTKPDYVIYGGIEGIKKENINVKKIISKYTKVLKKENIKYLSAVFFGRLDSQTSVEMYIEGAKLIREKYPNFKLDIYGDGEMKKIIPNSIKVLPFTSNIKVFRKYDYYFVSRYLSILEGLASKKIIFAVYDNKIKKDYLLLSPFSNFIIPVNSPKSLADEFNNIVTDKDKKNMLIEGGYNWVKKYTWENVIEVYLRLWFMKDGKISL